MVPSTASPSATHQSITQRIVQAIEAGAGDFVMPWHGLSARNGRPTNVATRKPYSGGNAIGLWSEAMLRGLSSKFWGTYRQWRLLGAQVRQGERGSAIVFFKQAGEEDSRADERPAVRFVVRSSVVFNAEQVDGWQEELPLTAPALADELEHVEAFVARTGARVWHGHNHACYDSRTDSIELPEREWFIGSPTSSATESYYATLLHELVHWTGAAHRLDRRFGERFGDASYAAEELVAELGAAFLCSDLKVSNVPRPDHAAYVASWLRILAQDSRAIFTAASLAGLATFFLQEVGSPSQA